MKRDVYEQWKERSGFLVALFGFCGFVLLCCNALRQKNRGNEKGEKSKKECVWQKGHSTQPLCVYVRQTAVQK